MMKKQIIDQAAHALAALALLAPLLLWPSLPAALLTGFGAGLIREVTEGGNIFSRGSCLDLAFWTLAGGAAWLLFH